MSYTRPIFHRPSEGDWHIATYTVNIVPRQFAVFREIVVASRAWCWRSIGALLPEEQHRLAARAADEHLSAARPHVAGDYAGEHWLASFALLALMAG